jgi:glutathione S-transferase
MVRALPRVRETLETMECELADDRAFIIDDVITLADFHLYPSLRAFALAPEGPRTLRDYPAVRAWRQRMDAVPSVVRLNETSRQPVPVG